MAAVRLGSQGAAAVAPDVTTPTVKKGFEWMPTYAPQAVGLRSATARTAAALNAGDVKRGVLHGVLPDVEIAAVEDPNLVRFTLPAAQAATVATQLRNTNAALFSPMAFDLVARLAQLSERPLSEVVKGAPGIDARIKALPHAPHGEMPTANIPDDMAIDDPFDLQRRSFERRSRIADSGRTAEDSEMPGPAYFRAPVGDYGDDLARALVDAARVLLREATEVCATVSSSSAYAEINPKLAIADDLAGTWAQGIEGMCSAVAALTAKRVPGKSVDDVLASLGDGSALSQFAARAPVYVLEPLVGSGHVSKDPLIIGENGKARLPLGIIGYARDSSKTREEFSADATSDYAQEQMQRGAGNSTETKRGCPLAAKAPVYDELGKLQMPESPALEKLSGQYIDLVRRLLRERSSS